MEHFYQDIDGWFWFEPAYRFLFDSLPDDRPSHFVEVGSYKGRSFAWLLVEAINSGKSVTLRAVDIWPSDAFTEFRNNVAPAERLLGQGRYLHSHRPSVEAAAFHDAESLDVVWLDADHSYEAVCADIDAWWPTVKPGGYLGGDDYLMEGVWKAVEERFSGRYMLIPGWATDAPGKRPYPSWIVRK